MFNSIDTSSGEIHNIGCKISFPKFIDYHNQLPNASNLPPSTNIKASRSKYRFPDLSKDHTASYENQALSQLPVSVLERKTFLICLNISNNVFEYFPLELLQIHTLRTLRMDYNKIKSLPSEISQLSNLECLSVGHNFLQFLPGSISHLSKLRELNLESNVLDSIPQEIDGLRSLRSLYLLYNRLDCLPTSFGKLEELKDISLEWFRYTEPRLSVVQKGFTAEQLREKCSELYAKGIKLLSFGDFLDIFSTKKKDFLSVDEQGRTLLHFACLNQDVSVIRYVITHVPELIDTSDKSNMTPLCLSLLEEKQRSWHCLIKYGADVTAGGGVVGSPLHIATKKLNFPAVKKILSLGENPNRIDNRGNTALHFAIELMAEKFDSMQKIIDCLLEHKADPNIKNHENWAPIHIVAKKRDAKTLNWILSYNLEVEEIYGGGELFKLNKCGGTFNWTPMHISAYVGAAELVYKLGEAGVNMFKKSVNGFTPKGVVTRNSLSLKLLEKYEQLWIRSNVLNKTIVHSESLAYQNVTKFNNMKEISNASKNKFEGVSVCISSPQENSLLLNLMVKNRVRMLSPLLGCGPMSKRQDYDDSMEMTPESLANLDGETEPSEDNELVDFNSELNEGVNIAVNPYSKETPLVQNKKEINIKTNKASQKYFEKQKSSAIAPQSFDLDVESYEDRLKLVSNFDLHFCKTELRYLKDHLTFSRISFVDKLKIFIALKILHKVIIEHIYVTFNIQTPTTLFPFISIGNIRKKAKDFDNTKSVNSNGINTFYDLVPQCLISCFMSLGNQNYETALIKSHILRALIDIKYYPAIDFFQSITGNELEVFIVKQEAKNGYNALSVALSDDAKRYSKTKSFF